MYLHLDRETITRNKGWGEKRVGWSIKRSSSPSPGPAQDSPKNQTKSQVQSLGLRVLSNTHWALGPSSLSWAGRIKDFGLFQISFWCKESKTYEKEISTAQECKWWWWWQNPEITDTQGKKNLVNLFITNNLNDSYLLETPHWAHRAGPVHSDKNKVCALKTLLSLIAEWELAEQTRFFSTTQAGLWPFCCLLLWMRVLSWG